LRALSRELESVYSLGWWVFGLACGTRTFEVTDLDLEELFTGVMPHLDERQRRRHQHHQTTI
jgi:hypothetical protein